MKINKVILITIDTLSYSRLGVAGNLPSPSPYIDKLIQENFSFDKSFTAGCPTMMSFPTIMSSCYPLDYGGYEHGVLGKPKTISEVFRDNNFKTAAYTAGSGTQENSFYNRGYDEYFSLTDLSLAVESFKRTVEYYFEKKLNNYTLDMLIDSTSFFLDYCLEYPSTKSKMLGNFFSSNEILFNWDFDKLKIFIEREASAFEANKIEFVQNLLNNNSDKFYDSIGNFKKKKGLIKRIDITTFKILLLEIKLLIQSYKRITILKFIKSLIKLMLSLFLNYSRERFVSGKYVIDHALKWAEVNRNEDFFLWLHTTDLHDMILQTEFKDGKDFRRNVANLNLQYLKDFDKTLNHNDYSRYDISLRLKDYLIEYFVNEIENLKLADETLIILTSDHGSRAIGAANRRYCRTNEEKLIGLQNRIHSTDFYDELYRIPTIFIHPEIDKIRRTDFFSSIDLTPTILGFVGIQYDKVVFRGADKSKQIDKLGYVIMENFGPGPADYYSKPIRIAVRSDNYKVICQKQINQELELLAVYNLRLDPSEINNLNPKEYNNYEVNNLIDVIRSRINEIDFNYRYSKNSSI